MPQTTTTTTTLTEILDRAQCDGVLVDREALTKAFAEFDIAPDTPLLTSKTTVSGLYVAMCQHPDYLFGTVFSTADLDGPSPGRREFKYLEETLTTIANEHLVSHGYVNDPADD